MVEFYRLFSTDPKNWSKKKIYIIIIYEKLKFKDLKLKQALYFVKTLNQIFKLQNSVV